MGKEQEEAREGDNGFTVTICGGCERKNGRMVGVGEKGAIHICQEIIAGSVVWRGILKHCTSKGLGKLELRSERVVARRALFGKEVEGMRVASVKIEGEGEESEVKVLDHVEAGFL